jgi:uncharacterized LabA/DUF88 family protein
MIETEQISYEETQTIAVCVDVQTLDNVDNVDTIETILNSRGRVISRVAYAEWKIVPDKLKERLRQLGYEMVEVPTLTASGKNGVDMKMTIGIMDALQGGESFDTIAIVGGDSDYTHIAKRCQRSGKHVIFLYHDGKTADAVKKDPSLEINAIDHVASKVIPRPAVGEGSPNDTRVRIPNDRGELALEPDQWITGLDVAEQSIGRGELKFNSIAFRIRDLEEGEGLSPKIAVIVLNTYIFHGMLVQPSRGKVLLAEDFETKRQAFIEKYHLD